MIYRVFVHFGRTRPCYPMLAYPFNSNQLLADFLWKMSIVGGGGYLRGKSPSLREEDGTPHFNQYMLVWPPT
jgi:hypothetical protein